jgi:hypothetical protein
MSDPDLGAGTGIRIRFFQRSDPDLVQNGTTLMVLDLNFGVYFSIALTS